jgi:glucose-1-phosphate thymidylyltransferase
LILPNDNLKIIIPMAGYGTRMRPHTWSKPKPLVSLAGKTVLDHVLQVFATAANPDEVELVFIVGYLGEQVEAYMAEHHPEVNAHYLVQQEMRGQSHAIALARQHLHGPTMVAFVDTIIDADLSSLTDEAADAVIWVKEVEDPRRFGVVAVGEDGLVKGIIEKPDSFDDKLAVVGFYYFKRGEDLLAAIDKQMSTGAQTKGEFYIADAIGLMLQDGLALRPHIVDVWLDAGVPETVLESNRYLLDHGLDDTAEAALRMDAEIHPPVFIHPSAHVEGSVIGPHVSIGAGCRVVKSTVKDSVLEPDAQVSDSQLEGSLIGARARVLRMRGSLNIGDDSAVEGRE